MKLTKQIKQLIGITSLLFFCSGITYAQSSLSESLQKSDTKKMQAKMSAVAPEKKAAIKNESVDQLTTPYKEMTPTQKLERLEKQYTDGRVHPSNYEAAKARLLELIKEQD